MTKSEIFTAAWELAERGVTDFGGSKKEYFAEALKIVHADIAAMENVNENQERQSLLAGILVNAGKAESKGANIDMAKVVSFVRQARTNKAYTSMDTIRKAAIHFKNKAA
ncbi:hypothetical protein [Enterococcus rotai]|uniref:hypothetical protein n=1 Tax=Enterococcus rotai TaxID=118060 RepID=UPI0032B3BE7A